MKKLQLFAICLSLVFTTPLFAEGVFLRAGYGTKQISTDSGYGEFLKNRYGTETLNLSGGVFSVGFPLIGGTWILEQSTLSASPTYTDLNDTTASYTIGLTSQVLGLAFELTPDWDFTLGYGKDTLKRSMIGYQSSVVTTDNLSTNDGSDTSEITGTHYMAQLLYRIFGESNRGDIGFRYDKGTMTIPEDDVRPAVSQDDGTPLASEFDLSGLVLLFNFTYGF
ncbi:MAG: hypothetical protein QNL04_09960 [SAR324 cluster bacterium]|nr:hypothetical protein [SAR324 cluster bacterium]